MTLLSVRPTTGESFQEHPALTSAQLQHRLERSLGAFEIWSGSSHEIRSLRLLALAGVLEGRKESLATTMTEEMGKPISEARSEVEKCAWVCRYYAEHAPAQLAPEPVDTEYRKSYVAFRPLGPILAVMPWNFPLWQVFRFAAPALAAGNVGLLKHASNVQNCAQAIESVFREAAFPEGAFLNLPIESKAVAFAIEHPAVRAVTLTGSSAAGRAVAAAAGAALKKTVLELGGSDPYVVLDDADLERAAEACVDSRLINSGQSCIAAKRFVVTRKRSEEFEQAVVSRMSAKIMGDPLRDDVEIGPMARVDLRDELHRQVRRSLDQGARLCLGGGVPSSEGAWYPPTVLADVTPGMPAHDEELFGPVAAIVTVADEDAAIETANRSSFGLGAAIFTANAERGEEIARDRLHAGAVFVNGFVRSDPRLPFGGIKESGYGRELGSFGIREFVNAKTIVVTD